MNTTTINTHKETNNIIIHAITGLLVTMFLFYIDEGYYNFKWMLSIGNWICFVIYAVGLFAGQIFVRKLLFKKSNSAHTVLSCIIGISVGLVFVIGVIFAGWWH